MVFLEVANFLFDLGMQVCSHQTDAKKTDMIENTEMMADVSCFPTFANVMYLLGLLASARVQPKVS